MIQPDRLKELIFQEKGCYVLFGSDIGYIHLNKEYKPEIQKNRDGEYFIYLYTNNEFESKDIIFVYDLFETEEEAEWALEFGNITREEKLSLPSWEEIKKGRATFFSDVNHLGFITPLDIIVINEYDDGSKTLLKTPLTKENYIEACRLAKKLFLGENDG